jgi:type IV secretory pathway TraG/TraD family ATPase VirD4
MESLIALGIFVWFMYIALVHVSKAFINFTPVEEKDISRIFFKGALSPFKYGLGEMFGAFHNDRFLGSFQKKSIISSSNKGILIDSSKNLRLSEETSYQNLLIRATTGMGKTSKFLVGMILDQAKTNKKTSMIILDPKAELYELTSGALMDKYGFDDVVILNPKDLDNSIAFNPLEFVQDEGDVEFIMRSLVMAALKGKGGNDGNSRFWNESAIQLLTLLGTLLVRMGIKTNNFTYTNLINVKFLLNSLSQATYTDLDKLVAKYADPFMLMEYNRFKSNEESVFLNIISTASMALAPIANNSNLRRLLASNSFDLDLRNRKVAIYIQIPVNEAENYEFLLNSFVSTMMKKRLLNETPRKDQNSVTFYADEIGSFYIKSFDNYIVVSRAYLITNIIIIQSESQLINRYGPVASEVILEGGVASKIYMGNGSDKSNTTLSNMIGKHYKNIQGRKTLEYSMQPSDIRALPSNKALVFIQNHKPFIQKLQPYYEQYKFKRLTQIKPYFQPYIQVVDQVEYLDIKGAL